jgi:catechol 2,3-dioxygenase-like lactoylglutathione lyase family enzyme
VDTVHYCVADYRRALRFYGETLGLRKVYEAEGGGFAIFEAGGSRLAIDTDWAPRWEPGSPTVALLVEGLDGLVSRLESEGVEVAQRPRRTRWGRTLALVQDPDGNGIELVEPVEQTE